MGVFRIALFMWAMVVIVHSEDSDRYCVRVDWDTFPQDFNEYGTVKCDENNYFLNGLERGKHSGSNDKIGDLDAGNCCPVSRGFSSNVNIDYAIWEDSFDLNNNWNECPDGFFLHGITRGAYKDTLAALKEGRCGKPVNHPRRRSELCYIEDVTWEAKSEESITCKADYFIVGLFRGECGQLSCLDKMRCCPMTEPDLLNSLAKAKILVMDTTQFDVANLAHYLGFGWCFGCRTYIPGEDFELNGDDYIAKKDGDCQSSSKTKNNRLVISYGDWNFVVTNMTYDNFSTQTIGPQTLSTYVLSNDGSSTAERTILENVEFTRQVTHFPTSDWTIISGDNLKIPYNPDDLPAPFMTDKGYEFTYSNETSTVDVTGKRQIKTIPVSETFTLNPGSNQTYSLNLYKTKLMRSYTLTAVLEYSVELSGFLRGKISGNEGTNYHKTYYQKTSHPDFTYKFGDTGTPFQDDLKTKSLTKTTPWKWDEMFKHYEPDAQKTVDRLIQEGILEFTFTGIFEDVVADSTSVRLEAEEWKEPVVG